MKTTTHPRPAPAASRASNGTLVRRCREHDDPDAWAELVRRHAACVYAIAGRGFGFTRLEAEDVFQETFARTYEHLANVREPEAISGYIRQMARRLCIDRQAARATMGEVPVDAADALTVEDSTLAKVALQQAVGRLPDANREVIERFFLEDQSYHTISLALEIPYGTIGSRIARGLRRLRLELDE
jgi:RNA polymerase sigma-70 factor (ECF subfamily)